MRYKIVYKRILWSLLAVGFPVSLSAITLLRSVPQNQAVNVKIDGKVVLMFDEDVVVGNGDCTLNGVSLPATVVSKNITFSFAGLEYETDYTFVVPQGAIRNKIGDQYAGTTIRFKTISRPEVTPKIFDFIVDPKAKPIAGKIGNTVKSAFDAMPNAFLGRYYVYIKNGYYDESLNMPDTKSNISIIGENRDSVIIANSRCPAVEIYGSNIYFENMTFKNTLNPDYNQYGIAIYAEGTKNIYKNVRFLGHQDTKRTGGDRHYFLNCDIRGTIDFIYGSGNIYYDRCSIYLEKRNKMMNEATTWDTACVIAAGSHSQDQVWGHVFQHCTIDGDSSNDGRYTLGRPWYNDCRAVYLNTTMKIKPFDFGWSSMGGNPPALYAEYNSLDAFGNPIDLSKRTNKYLCEGSLIEGKFNPVLDHETANKYTLRNVLSGNDAWKPDVLALSPEAPLVELEKDSIISWQKIPYCICYVVRHNGKVVNFVTEPSYVMQNSGDYTVQSVGENGFTSNQSTVITLSNGTGIVKKSMKNVLTLKDQTLIIDPTETQIQTLSIYNVLGECLSSLTLISGQKREIKLPYKGIFIVTVFENGINHHIKVLAE